MWLSNDCPRIVLWLSRLSSLSTLGTAFGCPRSLLLLTFFFYSQVIIRWFLVSSLKIDSILKIFWLISMLYDLSKNYLSLSMLSLSPLREGVRISILKTPMHTASTWGWSRTLGCPSSSQISDLVQIEELEDTEFQVLDSFLVIDSLNLIACCTLHPAPCTPELCVRVKQETLAVDLWGAHTEIDDDSL